MTFNENLNGLKQVISTECEARMQQDHRLDPSEVAEWLISHKRSEVIDGLKDLICGAKERINDEEKVKRVLESLPPDPIPRDPDEIQLWFHLENQEKELREARDRILRKREYFRPLMYSRPDVTIQEANWEMERGWRVANASGPLEDEEVLPF